MYKALATIDLTLDGRAVHLVEGEAVDVDELQGAALVAGGYVEHVDEEAQAADDDEEAPEA
jgi:hypothetical protein